MKTCCKKRQPDSPNQSEHSSHILTKSCSFYRLLLSSTQFDELRLPQKFGMEHGDELCGSATLIVPTGEFRTVGIIKENDTVSFGDGWKEFVEYFNIGYAYFLLFSYEGNLRFKVNIFDPTSSEVSYPCHSRVVNEHHLAHKLITEAEVPCKKELVGDGDSDDSSVQVLSTPFPEPKTLRIMNIVHLDSDDEHDCVGEKEVKSYDYSSDSPFEQEVPVWMKKYKPLIKAVTAAGISIPKNPFFIFQLKPYVLNRGQYMPIPSAFIRKHIKKKAAKTARLERRSGGKQWKVQLNSSFNLGIGWMMFARQNHFKVGDICVFELIHSKNIVFRVHVAHK